jgi:hypothetical protein
MHFTQPAAIGWVQVTGWEHHIRHPVELVQRPEGNCPLTAADSRE